MKKMETKVLKIILADKTNELRRFEFLGKDIYSTENIFYKFVEDYSEINEIANCFKNEGYKCIIDNDTLYVIGLSKVLWEEWAKIVAKIDKKLQHIHTPDFGELVDGNTVEEKDNNDTENET